MLTSAILKKPMQTLLGHVFATLSLLGLSASSVAIAQTNTTTPTTINVTDSILTKNAQRLGVNLGTQNFWDSGLMMRNLAFRNPGFEAETWQSILHCQFVTANSCTDDNQYTYWPANFLAGATASFIVGPAAGTTATVTSSTAANIGSLGVTIQMSGLSTAPSVGDYIVVRMNVPGNAPAGWWTWSTGGATFGTDTTDLSPNTIGKQAVSLNASGAGQGLTFSNFDDGTGGRNFITLSGSYTLSFRAKGIGGGNQVQITFGRNLFAGSSVNFFSKTLNLTNSWQDYSYTFQANDTTQPGTLALQFALYGSSMLLDDVSLSEVAAPNNPTVYRNSVLQTLQALQPGTIRYMDGGRNWGSSIDNLLTPDFARLRAGYSNLGSEQDDMAMGLHDFLVLCQTVGADPWFTMPTGMTTQEMSNLMDYFGGSTSTVYGARRAALGQTAPWTTVFGTIHLEFGNEVWNTANPGASMTDAASYGKRAGVIFSTAKASPSYSPKSFDFIQDGFEAVTYWTQTALANSNDYDTVDVATYNFANFNDASSVENIFGPMLSEPEWFNSNSTGATAQQASIAATASRPAHLAVYETNMGAIAGTTTQAQNNSALPSLGAGLAVAANMLLAQRDLGVTVQNMFSLEGYNTGFNSTASSPATTSPIWGVTIDMGGPTNLRRPMFLSEELANRAILPTMFATTQTGANPTWNQAFTTNDNFSLPNAHYIQSFAYSDGTTQNLILLNLSRTSALPVNFAGLNAPLGAATISTLTAAAIDSTNESQSNVAITSTSATLAANTVLSLPAYSMTVVSTAAPVVPVMVYSVKVACANTALSPTQTTSCTGTVAGQGSYNAGVTWSTNQGTVSSTGAYTAPATLPASGNAVITATSVGDTTKSGSYTLTLAPNTITSVAATCPATTIAQGNNLTCAATVKGTGGYSTALTWSVSSGSITPTGILTVPTTGSTLTVTATSVQDPTKSSKVTLAVTPVLTMTQPTATVTATTATVSWTINMPANSAVAYALTPGGAGYSTPYNPSTTTSPSLTITGLQPSTTYYLSPYSFVNGQTAAKSLTIRTNSSNSTVASVAVACPGGALTGGSSTTCAATVAGTGSYASTVNWTASVGTITPGGVLTIPASTTATAVTVTATSTQDATKSASTVVSITPPSTITGVSVACAATTVWASSTTNCASSVTGTNGFSSSVTWSASGGSINSAGVLTVPATGATVTVTATSTQDPTKSGSTTLTVTPALAITGTPSISVTSTTITVSWAVNNAQAHNGLFYGTTPAMGGITNYDPNATASPSYTLTGLTPGTTYYLAALSFVGTQSVTKPLTATTSPSAAVSSVSVRCPLLTLVAGNSAACSAVVAGTGSYSSAVTWSTSAGTINPNGLLTTSSTITSPTTAIVTATSTQDPTKSASATITINPAPSITSVIPTCAAASIVPSASTACTVAVAGTGSYSPAVTWSASAGTISPTGVLTAPAAEGTVTVTATSVQDPTKSASTTVQVKQILAIVNPIISATSTTIVVSWTVTEVAVNGVRHDNGPGTAWTEIRNNTPSATPTFTLSGLTPGTTYNGVIYSTNSSGTVSQSITVTTPLNQPTNIKVK
jgi:alpha-L-arabinofuranosidase